MNEEKLLAKVAAIASILLAASGTMCLLALFYAVYSYGWAGQRVIAGWGGVLVYYVLPAVLAALLFASLRLRPTYRVNIALVLCSAGATLYALEIGLTVWRSLPSVNANEDRRIRAAAAEAIGLDFDTRSRWEVARDLVSQGADAVPSLSPRILLERNGAVKSPIVIDGVEVLPLTSMANKLTVLCNETGQFVVFKSDRHGFRNPPEVWDRAPVGIAAVGDSFTQGHCVNNDFVTVIRTRYPATLNLGVGGNGPLATLATVKEYARTVRPKVVLWFYAENDLPDLSREAMSPLLRRYLTAGFSQNLIARQSDIDRSLRDYLETVTAKSDWAIKLEEMSIFLGGFRDGSTTRMRMAGIIKLARLRQRLGLVYGTSSNPAAGEARPLRDRERLLMAMLQEVLVEARRTVHEWGGRLHIVYLPAWGSYVAKRNDASPVRAQVLLAAEKAGLPVIDIHPSFERHADPLALFPFRLNGHYTEEGNRLVAAEVLRSISVDQ